MASNATYHRRRAEGRCGSCGNEPAPGRVSCQPCIDAGAARAHARYKRLQAEGLCPRCGRTEPEPDYAWCWDCYCAHTERLEDAA